MESNVYASSASALAAIDTQQQGCHPSLHPELARMWAPSRVTALSALRRSGHKGGMLRAHPAMHL
jgi:hypothetical protein